MLDRLKRLVGRNDSAGGKATYLGLRSLAFTIDPATIQVSHDSHLRPAWCALLEFGRPEGSATLMAVADGTVSLYTSAGGGIIGAGEHEAVRMAADRFLEEASDAAVFMRPIGEDPAPPVAGHVAIHVRTFDATLSAELTENALQRGRHELAPLYAAGQDLLTEVRLATDAAAEGGSSS